MTSWKTSLMGVLLVLVAAAGPVLEAYYPIKGLNWVALMTSLTAAIGGAGLIMAKDRDVHSTDDQIADATQRVKAKEVVDSIQKL